jgi:hypothetical protein
MNPAASEQPKPRGSGIPIVDLVKADLEARAQVGELKYGERLKANNGRDGLMDAYQEAVDLVVYLRQVIEERNLGQIAWECKTCGWRSGKMPVAQAQHFHYQFNKNTNHYCPGNVSQVNV